MTPAPRTSDTIGCAAAMACRRCFEMRADRRDVRQQAAVEQLVDEVQPGAAGQQVAAIRAAVIAGRDGPATDSRSSAAPMGMPPPSALPIEIRSGSRPSAVEWNACPVRPRPLCTSSAMTSVPVRSAAARMAATNAAGSGRTPPSP